MLLVISSLSDEILSHQLRHLDLMALKLIFFFAKQENVLQHGQSLRNQTQTHVTLVSMVTIF